LFSSLTKETFVANDWYGGWGWFLWLGMILLIFSSAGNWGYTYQAHRRYRDFPSGGKDALDLLSDRYARGEINRDEFHRVKNEIIDVRSHQNKNRAGSSPISLQTHPSV
jgi:putative membrane protein